VDFLAARGHLMKNPRPTTASSWAGRIAAQLGGCADHKDRHLFACPFLAHTFAFMFLRELTIDMALSTVMRWKPKSAPADERA